jgi:hypothetical protein
VTTPLGPCSRGQRLGAWHGDLDTGCRRTNEDRPSRARLTLIRIFEELHGLGCQGSYDAVRRYAKKWHVERGAVTGEAYVPLSFASGEAFQFDWSHEVVLINGTTVITVTVAHVRLCHSRILFVRAYPREIQEMAFDAHNRAFAFFRGTCTARLEAGLGHRAAATPGRGDHRRDGQCNGLAAPHGARPDLRSAEEKARARHCVGEDGSRPVLPDYRELSGGTMSTGEDLGTALAGLERASRHRLAGRDRAQRRPLPRAARGNS